MRWLSLSLITLLTITGCQLTHVEGEVDDVKIKVSSKDDDHSGKGSFCPPGQAKKGNC